mgnify:CR=1 FL=1
MNQYLETGESFYDLADGCHDHAVSLLMHEAAKTGTEVTVAQLPWMEEN